MSSAGASTTTKPVELKRVYLFKDAGDIPFLNKSQNESGIASDAGAKMREIFGGKGAGLIEMTASGINVPPGLTITTNCCREYNDNGQKMPPGLMDEVIAQLNEVENLLNRRLGDNDHPLLVSVRSGAKFSMPGMMDTILNLGLNDQTVASLARLTNNARFAFDSYRRFIQMYGNVVLSISKDKFEDLLAETKEKYCLKTDADLNAEQLQELVRAYKELVVGEKNMEFPQNAHEQLAGAIEAVFRSWNNPRAIYYRNLNKIDHNLGTAVNVQAMVFGNLDNTSATGVCFTRNPSTGEKVLYGEYLTNAQGEDVVAGIRTPKKVSELQKEMPAVYEELLAMAARLEKYYRDVQDIEFTVEQKHLYILQTRTGKRTAKAAVKIAVALHEEGILDRDEAIKRVDPLQLNQLLLPSFNPDDQAKAKREGRLFATGLNASPGAAIGKIVFDPTEAEKLAVHGSKIILVRVETCPDDIHGIVPAQGVVTARGGMTSHAAVVARGMGKPCIAGCEALKIDMGKEQFTVGEQIFKKGDVISIDGSTGELFKGEIATHKAEFFPEFKTLLTWADQKRTLGVKANADTPEDAGTAREFGAEGVGLCRTEHMFMSQDRLPHMQQMIMANNTEERKLALAKLLPMQRQDFKGILKAMHDRPVTIRLLDPPLHEFLPKQEALIEEIAALRTAGGDKALLREKTVLLGKVRELQEANPMMGLRGCRLGLLYPEINEMQVQAIFEAAIECQREGIVVHPEIMIPLVGHVNELRLARKQLESIARAIMEREKITVNYKFGTMIEVPRACVTADEIAEYAEFFSFGTNDLTQMTFGFSRDDAEGKFLQRYLDGIECNGSKQPILKNNPFEVLDQAGVGKMMKIAVEYGLQTRPDLQIGICGEHGGEPTSIAFAHQLGLTYVSCSPYRVPIARLAAAQAAIGTTDGDK